MICFSELAFSEARESSLITLLISAPADVNELRALLIRETFRLFLAGFGFCFGLSFFS